MGPQEGKAGWNDDLLKEHPTFCGSEEYKGGSKRRPPFRLTFVGLVIAEQNELPKKDAFVGRGLQ